MKAVLIGELIGGVLGRSCDEWKYDNGQYFLSDGECIIIFII